MEIPTPAPVNNFQIQRRTYDDLPKLMEEAKIAQITAGELKAESILIKTVPATLKPFGSTLLTGFKVEMKLCFCVESPLSEAKMLFASKAPYSLASSSESTRVTPNSSVCTTWPRTDIGDRLYLVSGRQKNASKQPKPEKIVRSQ